MLTIQADYNENLSLKNRSISNIVGQPVLINYDAIISNISGTQTTENIAGSSLQKTTSASATKDGTIRVDGFSPTGFESLNPSIATVDPAGVVQRISDGSTLVKVKSTFGIDVGIIVDVLNIQSETIYKYLSALSGSFIQSLRADTESLFSGSPSSGNDELFSTFDHTSPSYSRNPTNELSSYDLTGICIRNVSGNNNRVAHAISPIHCAGTTHFASNIGDVLTWVTSDNQVINRTVVARAKQPERPDSFGWNSNYGQYDLALFRLDSPLPNTIKPFNTLHKEIIDYCTHFNYTANESAKLSDFPKGAMVVRGNRIVENRYICPSILAKTDSFFDRAIVTPFTRITSSLPWSQDAFIVGDSSSWAGIFDDSNAIMTHSLTRASGSGTSISQNQDWVNQTLINLDSEVAGTYPYTVDGFWPDNSNGSYQLKTLDLSGFTLT